MKGSTTNAGWREVRIDVAATLTDAVASVLADDDATTVVIETTAPGRTP